MPRDLAALLVGEGAVSAEGVERAVARQRDAGGTLDTALLEAGAIAEETLLAYLSRAAELPAAPPTAWSGGDARARRVFPSRVAERHGLAPFALEGRELSLVATYPVDLALLDEISFMLSLHLNAHVGPEWRVRELIHRLYGSPLPPRLAALAPPADAAPPQDALAPGEGRPPAPTAGQPAGVGFARDDAEPLEPLAAALAQAIEAVDVPLDDGPSDAPAPDAGERDAEEAAGAGTEEPADPAEAAAPPDRTAPPRWTIEDARRALAATRDRDEVVLAALRYARDFFEFAAMFAVTRDAVAGHDALGSDALGSEEARERCRAVAIWASDPGTFKTAIETRSPHLGPFPRDPPGNEAILCALGRAPRTALVYPVLLRDRPVCVLYADNGEAPVSPRRLGDLLLFLSTVGSAFERIIRDRKTRRRRTRRQVAASDEARPSEPPLAEATLPEAPLPGAPPSRASLDGAPLEAPSPAASLSEPAPSDAAPLEAVATAPRAAESLAALDEQLSSVTLDLSDLDAPEPAAAPGRAEPGSAPALAAADGEPAAPRPATSDPQPEAAATARTLRLPAASAEEPPAPAALADRALDPDPAVSSAACDALARRSRDAALRPAVEKLRRALLSGMSARATRGACALGALRDVDSIPLLIQVLEASEPETARAAADALSAITLQRLGPDARRWLGWWKANRGRGRAEWLFSGLTSPDRQTRVTASVELSLSAPPPVAYSADMPAAEREKAAREWAGWWSRSGHVL